MKELFNVRGVAAVLVALFIAQTSWAAGEQQVPVISGANDEATGLKIDADQSKKTKISTDWELSMATGEANDNGHALFYHDGYVYTYLNRYGISSKVNPVMRRYDASGNDNLPEVKELPFVDVPEIWDVFNLKIHTVFQDNQGMFLFVFALSDKELRIMSYDYATNTIGYSEKVVVSGNNAGLGMNNSSIALCKGSISGSIIDDFELKSYIGGSVGNGKASKTCYYDMVVSKAGSEISARLSDCVYDHKKLLESGLRNVDFCSIDGTHCVVSLLFSDIETAKREGISLFSVDSDGKFAKIESWTEDSNLFPSISANSASKGDCFGMNMVKHDDHNILVYAKSYVGDQGVVYNVVLWDDPSSFGKMKHIASIKVPGKVTGSVYQIGMRQLVAQVPQGEALSRDGDYHSETTFFTYAPGAALARHTIITETDKIQTGIAAVTAECGLSIEGRTVRNSGVMPLAVYDAGGCLVAEYPAAAEVTLDDLKPGFYIIESGADAIKAVLR